MFDGMKYQPHESQAGRPSFGTARKSIAEQVVEGQPVHGTTAAAEKAQFSNRVDGPAIQDLQHKLHR